MIEEIRKWFVIEYDDGTLKIVPNCWIKKGLDEKELCHWPGNHFVNDKHYENAVRKYMYPKLDVWPLREVKVLGIYEKYLQGYEELKKALEAESSKMETSSKDLDQKESKLPTDEKVETLTSKLANEKSEKTFDLQEGDGILSKEEKQNPGPTIAIGKDEKNHSSFDESMDAEPSPIANNQNSDVKSDKEGDKILSMEEKQNYGLTTAMGKDEENHSSSFDEEAMDAAPSPIANNHNIDVKLDEDDDGILSKEEKQNSGPTTDIGKDEENLSSSFDESMDVDQNTDVKSDEEGDGVLSKEEKQNPGSTTDIGKDEENHSSSFDEEAMDAAPSPIANNHNSDIKSDEEGDEVLSKEEKQNPESTTDIGKDEENHSCSFDEDAMDTAPSPIANNHNSDVKSDEEGDGVLSKEEKQNPGSTTDIGKDEKNHFSSIDQLIDTEDLAQKNLSKLPTAEKTESLTSKLVHEKSEKIFDLQEGDGILSEEKPNTEPTTAIGKDEETQSSYLDRSMDTEPLPIPNNQNSDVESDESKDDDGTLSQSETNNPGPSITDNDQEVLETLDGHINAVRLIMLQVEKEYLEQLSQIKKYDYCTIEDILNDFPIQNDNHLQIIEIKLKHDDAFRTRMMKAVTEIGAMKTSFNVSLMFSKIFDDELATLYNWKGNEGKKSLTSLMIVKMIVDDVLKHAGNTNHEEITKSVENWLQKAEARYQTKLIENNTMKPTTSRSC